MNTPLNPPPSLIETLRSTADADIPLLARHLRRLSASARALQYPCPLREIEQALRAMAVQFQGHDHKLRLLLHADGEFELSGQLLPPPATGSLSVVLAETRLHVPDQWLHHKTTYRPMYERASQWLHAHPMYVDCLFLNQHDQCCEGSRSNLYLQLDGAWYTPPLSCGVLPGVMRETLLASGKVRERVLSLNDMARAQAVRVSNAVRGWVDVGLDRRRIVTL